MYKRQGEYGINIDEKMGNDTFEYLIADSYTEGKKVPEGFVTRTIPELTWAVFPSVGAMPDALQDVNTKIFKMCIRDRKMWTSELVVCKSSIIASSISRSFAVKLETGIGFNPFYMFGVVT